MKEKYYTVAKTISRWKLDNLFENWLGYRADRSPFWKKLYVLYYSLSDFKYARKGKQMAKAAAHKWIEERHAPVGKLSFDEIVTDMIYSLHRFGASYEDYFIYEFYDLSSGGREKYNTLKIHYGYCELVNGEGVRALFEDKGACYETFAPFYKRDVFVYRGPDASDGMVAFFAKHDSFIFKPIAGCSGKGIKIYHGASAVKSYEKALAFLGVTSSSGQSFVLEELIVQGEEMARLHPESINTLRVVTFKQRDGVNIIGAAVRMGTGLSFVDNAGLGGIYAGVDVSEGVIYSIACDNYNNRYTKHPDSGIILPGYPIPKWNSALDLVRRMAVTVKDAIVISWDLAYSVNGWCMVEGNDVGDFHLTQVPYRHGIKDIIIENIDNYLNN